MLYSLGCILILGLFLGAIAEKIKLPKLVGMLFAGIILGPYCLNQIDLKVLAISSDIRKVALIIILLKAGLSLDLNDLKKAGRSAICLSFLPASFEILGYILILPYVTGCTILDAAIIGSILAAVSPAVVVPRMVKLIEEGYGTEKVIPQMILAGSSCDDVFVIVLFTSFISMATGSGINIRNFLNIPISIFLGIILGIGVGFILSKIFNVLKDSALQVCLLLGISCLFVLIDDYLPISGLLVVISLATTLHHLMDVKILSTHFSEIWKFAEILLFVLVGAAVNIQYLGVVGIKAVLVIILALLFRCVGVLLSVVKTGLNKKEILFCMIAYLPKATVQAAISSIPLSMGLKCGELALSIAVMGILITAPLGAFLIDNFYKKLLVQH